MPTATTPTGADPVLTPLTRAQAARFVHLCLTTATRLGLDVAYEGGAALVPVEPTAQARSSA